MVRILKFSVGIEKIGLLYETLYNARNMVNGEDGIISSIYGREERKQRREKLLLLHSVLLLTSLSGVTQKMAASYPLLSAPNLLFYAGTLALMGLYAVCWQRVLRGLPLSFAYANKGISQIWALLWSWLIFGEVITVKMAVGAFMIVVGIFWLGRQGESG